MRITVRYLAQLKQAAGVATESATSEERTPRGLLMFLSERHGDALRRLLLDADGQPTATILVFVNDRQLEPGMLLCDLSDMTFQKVAIQRRVDCPVCGSESAIAKERNEMKP